MKAGWEVKPLGEVAKLHYGKALAKAERNPDGGVPIYGANGVLGWSDHILSEGPSLIVGRKGSAGEVNRADGPFWPSDVTYYTEHDATKLDFEFFHYGMLTLDIPSLAKGVKPGINRNEAYALDFPIPPLEEQKRIVAVLDAAFEGLTRAKENAEANLQNARELFESYLAKVFSGALQGWKPVTVGDVLTLQRGFDITKKEQRAGTIPVVSSGGAKSFHDEAKCSAPGVVIGRKGSIGTVHYIAEDYWPHDTTLWVKDFKGNSPRLVSYLLSGLRLHELDTGAANPSLNRNLVHPLKVFWPQGMDQEKIADGLEEIGDSSSSVQNDYRMKLTDISDLRQSLLQKAFAGELT